MADVGSNISGALHDFLSNVIPYPIFRILAGFSNLIYHLIGTSNDPTSWSSTLLPPLITFFLAYFALVIAYRTVRNMLALAWWGMKWGAIIGAVIAVWAWWTDGTEALHSVGQPPANGFIDQIGRFSAILSQFQNSGSSNTRHNAINNQDFTTGIDDYLPQGLGAGIDAFTNLFGGGNEQEQVNGVDFNRLLRMMVTEGRRQGIDAAAALGAAGRVQDEMRQFQQDPTAWFSSVSERFKMNPEAADQTSAHGYNTRARTRNTLNNQQQQGSGSSWWGKLAKGLGAMMESGDANSNHRESRRRSERDPDHV